MAFGDGHRIRWDQHSQEVFRGNPNIAPPGSETASDIEWVPFFKGNRLYNRQEGNRWVWDYTFRPTPGEMYFSNDELLEGKRHGRGFVLIEPFVAAWKSGAINKDWGRARYQAVADRLRHAGHQVVQLRYSKGGPPLANVTQITTSSFRQALAVMRNAALYVGVEGGLHHGAAAVDVPAVVLFGGWIPPSVTGYDTHTNLTGGASEFCGALKPCLHCRAALDRIDVEEVVDAAQRRLQP